MYKKHKVSYDSSLKTGFIVYKTDGTNHVFMPFKMGLFFSDVKSNTVHVMINTLDRIKKKENLQDLPNYELRFCSGNEKFKLDQILFADEDSKLCFFAESRMSNQWRNSFLQ